MMQRKNAKCGRDRLFLFLPLFQLKFVCGGCSGRGEGKYFYWHFWRFHTNGAHSLNSASTMRRSGYCEQAMNAQFGIQAPCRNCIQYSYRDAAP